MVVIGGGNTAMDAARAAKRLPGVETVSLVYRRTRRYMPADQEELELALADGVEFRELLAPVGVRDGVLTCRVMELGAPDATGRRSPVDTGRTAEVPADTVITAVGEKVDTELYTANGLSVDQRGRAVVNPDTLESSVKHVFVVGDGQKGPGTVVEAIAGAAKAAQAIHPFDADAWVEQNVNPDYQKPLAKRGDVCTDCASYEGQPLPGLRHRVRDLHRGVPQPGQCGGVGARHAPAPDHPRGRHVQRVRQLRHLLPLWQPPLPGQVHPVLERGRL